MNQDIFNFWFNEPNVVNKCKINKIKIMNNVSISNSNYINMS